jgi:hypothetical protein
MVCWARTLDFGVFVSALEISKVSLVLNVSTAFELQFEVV